jgi:hypothetical protein
MKQYQQYLNEFWDLLNERKDMEYATHISKISDKIFAFLRRNKSRLFSVALRTENGYYIKYSTIDPKTKFDDLYIAILNKATAYYNLTKKITAENKAALATIKDGEKTFYVLKLFIIENDQTLTQVVNTILKSPLWSSTISHELTHYIDIKRQTPGYSDQPLRKDLKFNDEDVEVVLNSLKKYYNLSDEINAYFHQTAGMFLNATRKRKDKLDFINMSFETFKNAFLHFYGKKNFESLTEKNRKKVLSRIYLFYKDIQEYMQKKAKI